MLSALCLTLLAQDVVPEPGIQPTLEELGHAARVAGHTFTTEELELMLADVRETLDGFERLRAPHLDNSVSPATTFSPLLPGIEERALRYETAPLRGVDVGERPADLEALAFCDIPTLSAWIHSRRVSCVELAEMFLARLERLDQELHCVVTFTRERALAQAQRLDRELADGTTRGPLHGIPWGAKDLLATRGARTTWGAKPFEHQVIDADAAVVQRLDAAGAVMIAKLSLGALAWGDVWFAAQTRNPWDPRQGSSGSSAGSASATAAGGVAFAIGSETLGSIVSPSARCGNSSLRPTFGRVSRDGAMALSWTMDKLGPICRSAEDAALVFDAIHGPDGRDPTVIDRPFTWPGAIDVRGMRVGLPKGAFDEDGRGGQAKRVLDELRALGVELVDVELPDYPVGEMLIILSVEGATAFDELTRSGQDDLLVRQIRQAWPNTFRAARLIPAVEYLRAQRLRTQLMKDLGDALAGVDVLVHPSFGGGVLSMTNLTGHPTFVAPAGFHESGRPWSISFTGQLFDEARLLALASAWQRSTEYHERRPDLSFAARVTEER